MTEGKLTAQSFDAQPFGTLIRARLCKLSCVRDFNRLEVWKKAHTLALEIDATCLQLPRERSAIRSQMRRAAESIPTNIVEGCNRASQKELASFLQIAIGSSSELEYQLRLARDYGAIDLRAWQRLTDQTIEVRKMLMGLIKKVRLSFVR